MSRTRRAIAQRMILALADGRQVVIDYGAHGQDVTVTAPEGVEISVEKS